jgi:hypothetical protein
VGKGIFQPVSDDVHGPKKGAAGRSLGLVDFELRRILTLVVIIVLAHTDNGRLGLRLELLL